MSTDKNVMLIPKIESGIVIDHIPAGFGVRILEIISHYTQVTDTIISLGLNYQSQRLGRKDLIKLQVEYLDPEIIQHISIVVPGVTVKAIKNFAVQNKVVVQPPHEIRNLLHCKNPKCISTTEQAIETHFKMVDPASKKVKCVYCERIFDLHELKLKQVF
jgi:aspartate carbamoyltransferase regulatory subunit